MQDGKAIGKDQPYPLSTNVKKGRTEQSGYRTLIRFRKTTSCGQMSGTRFPLRSHFAQPRDRTEPDTRLHGTTNSHACIRCYAQDCGMPIERKTHLSVNGMHCALCAPRLLESIRKNTLSVVVSAKIACISRARPTAFIDRHQRGDIEIIAIRGLDGRTTRQQSPRERYVAGVIRGEHVEQRIRGEGPRRLNGCIVDAR